MADLSFVDFSDVVDTGTIDAVPAGTYVARIVDSDLKDTKSGTGKYVQVTWEILEGECARRKVFDRFNVVNSNPVAANIGKAQYRRLCVALGFPSEQPRTEPLHGIPCRIKVAVKNDPQYGDSNEVKGYEAVANARPGMAAPAPSTPPKPAAGQAPWARNKAA